jgi:hypothetical protein
MNQLILAKLVPRGRVMARHQVITTKPTMPPERAIRVLRQLIDESEALKMEDAYSNKRDLWKQKAHGVLVLAFGQPHHIFTDFDGFMEFSSLDDSPRIRLERQNEYLGYRVTALQSAVEQLNLQLPETQHQTLFPAGSQHTAFVEIRNVIAKVKTEVLVVDAHVDGSLWKLLTNVAPGSSIRILTAYPKADFAVEGQAFKKQHGNPTEARTTKDFHDRFIFVDAGECWHLGASIRDAGAKVFLFSEIADSKNRQVIRQIAEDTWKMATVLF